jgi:uncharacterized protein (TIGR00288 family)
MSKKTNFLEDTIIILLDIILKLIKFPSHQRKAAILVDYENIANGAVSLGKIFDLKALINMCLENFGIIKVAIVFVPVHLAEQNLDNFDDAGFDCVVCPRRVIHEKDKDSVDSRMIQMSEKLFDENSDITDIVIVSNDGDFIPLVNFFKQRGKKVSLFGLGEISVALEKVVDIVYEAPTKKK